MKKGKITILASVIAMLLVAGAVGAGTMAYFSDTETSSGNVFTAGTINLELGAVSSNPTPIPLMKPGDKVYGMSTVNNIGNLDGLLFGRTTYTYTDPTAAGPNTGTDLGDMLIVTGWAYGETVVTQAAISVTNVMTLRQAVDLPGYTVDTFSDDWQFYGTLEAGKTGYFEIQVEFDPLAGNEYQGCEITVMYEYLLVQEGHPITPPT